MSADRDLRSRLAASGGIVPGVPVVVACSGGRDSLCLLDLTVRIAGPEAVLAVHVHHGLRGAEADRDAAHVAAVAARLGTALRIVRLRPPDPLPGSVAAWAREAHWAALRAAADRWGPGVDVLVAHTASDQAETVLLRAISSPGIRALAGMPERDLRRGLRRPLLAAAVTRAEAGAWCAEHGLRWRDDGSNPTGPRGRVRAALAGLEAVDPRAVGALVATAARAREDDDALTAAAAALVDGDPGEGIATAALAAAPVAVARRALRRIAEDAVGRPCSRIERRLEEVLALDPRRRGRAALDVGDGVRVVATAERTWCEPLAS